MTKNEPVNNPIQPKASDTEGKSAEAKEGDKQKSETTAPVDAPISSICAFFGSLPACIVLSFSIHLASYGALGSFDGRMNLAAELICYCVILLAFGLTAIVLTWLITFCVARFALITEENLLRLNENLYQGTLSVISGLQIGMVKLQKGLKALGQTPKIVYTKLGGVLSDLSAYTTQLPTTLWAFLTMAPSPATKKEDEEEDDIKKIPMVELTKEEVADTGEVLDIEKENREALDKYNENMRKQRAAIDAKKEEMNRHWEITTYTQRGILLISFGAMATTAAFLALKQQVH